MRHYFSARSALLASIAILGVLLLGPASAQRDNERFVDAARALELFTTDEEHGIPTDILQRAERTTLGLKLYAYTTNIEIVTHRINSFNLR